MMRFKLGLMVGFAAGYYLGTKAGRERYHQINQWIHKAKNSEVVELAEEKVKETLHGDRVSAPGSVSSSLPSDLPA